MLNKKFLNVALSFIGLKVVISSFFYIISFVTNSKLPIGSESSGIISGIVSILYSSWLLFLYSPSLFRETLTPKFKKIKINNILIIIGLILLFLVNNFIHKLFFPFPFYTLISIVSLFFSSIGEEFFYRGFALQYLEENTKEGSLGNKITQSNLIITFLFFLSHVGYFFVLPFGGAFILNFVAIIFSLSMGVLMRSTSNLYLVSAVHVLLNFIHVFIANF